MNTQALTRALAFSLPALAFSLVTDVAVAQDQPEARAAVSRAQQAAPAAEANPSQDDSSDEPTPALEFADLNFADALSRAERVEKMIVILWHNEGGGPGTKWVTEVFEDEGVKEWVRGNAIAVRIDADAHPKDARRNVIGTENLPVVDVFDVRRGGRLERLSRGANAIDLLAAVYGLGDETGSVEKPDVSTDHEPFRWLAWANARFRSTDDQSGPDAVFGYSWCLHLADDYRPGFRARYLEFLLRRVAECKMRSVESVVVFEQERTKLGDRMRAGTATRRDAYELSRVDFWYRKELLTRDLFLELGGRGTNQDQCRKWLLSDVVGTLGRYEQYAPILETIEHDPVEVFRRRIGTLKLDSGPSASEDAAADEASAGSAAETAAEAALEAVPADARWRFDPESFEPALQERLEYTISDTRSDIIHDASWVFEALLVDGRGADAKELRQMIFETFPVSRSYGLFFERALRLELYGLAAEIADTGIAVLDERGQKRMRRLLNKIPAETSADK